MIKTTVRVSFVVDVDIDSSQKLELPLRTVNAEAVDGAVKYLHSLLHNRAGIMLHGGALRVVTITHDTEVGK